MKQFLNCLMVPVAILSLSSCGSEDEKSNVVVTAERPTCSAEFLGKYNNLVDEINNSGYFQKKHTLTEEDIDFDEEYRKLLRLGIQSKVWALAIEESCKNGESVIHPFKDPNFAKVRSFVLSYDLLRNSVGPLKKFESETGIRFTDYAGPVRKLADIVDLKFYDQKYKEMPDYHRTFKLIRSELNELRSSLIQLQHEFEEKGLEKEGFDSSGFQLVFEKTAALSEQITKDFQFIEKDRAGRGEGTPEFDNWKFIKYSGLFDRSGIEAITIKAKQLEDRLNGYKTALEDPMVESEIKTQIKTVIRTEIARICRKALGLPEEASDAMIEKAFRFRSPEFHTDKMVGSENNKLQIPEEQKHELGEIFKFINGLKELYNDHVKTAP